jgi:hypothetical protein
MAAYRDSGPGGDADVLRHAGTNLLDAESVSYKDDDRTRLRPRRTDAR